MTCGIPRAAVNRAPRSPVACEAGHRSRNGAAEDTNGRLTAARCEKMAHGTYAWNPPGTTAVPGCPRLASMYNLIFARALNAY